MTAVLFLKVHGPPITGAMIGLRRLDVYFVCIYMTDALCPFNQGNRHEFEV